MSKIKAFFLDRDGVINEDNGYIYKIVDFKFIDGIIDTLLYIQNKGYKLFIISNQSGIAKGFFHLSDFKELSDWMINYLRSKKVIISSINCCPHSANDLCECRKPKTGMIKEILKLYNIDLNKSWIVGDKNSDIECGINAKIGNKILLRSKYWSVKKKSIADYELNFLSDIKKINI